jgi:hypothetical protein
MIPRSTARLQQTAPLLLLAIVVLGGALRFYRIGEQSLWLDEAFSVWLARHPLREMFGWVVKIDQHPPLYYTLLHFWVSVFGDSAPTVRALSALVGTITIPLIYLIGCRLADGDRAVGLLAAAILALSPFHVRFAQEARMYTLLTLNAALAVYALLRLLSDSPATASAAQQQAAPRCADSAAEAGQEGHRHRRARALVRSRPPSPGRCLAWPGYVFFTVATLLSHNTAVFFPLATNVFILGMLWLRRHSDYLHLPSIRNWLLAQGGILLLWSPWLAAFVSQSLGVYREFWIPPPALHTVLSAFAALLSDFLPHRFWIMWAAFGLLILCGASYFRLRPAYLALLLVLVVTPFAGELLVSLVRPIFYDRTLIWASLPLYLLLAAGIRRLRTWPWMPVALLTVAAANGISLREYYVNFEKEQWDDAAAFVAQRVEANDVILFNATWVQLPFDFYFRSCHKQVTEHGVPVDLFDRGVLEPKMTEDDLPRLRALIQGHDRVWLVYSHNWYTDPVGLIPAALEKEMELLGNWRFHGLQVYLYGARRQSKLYTGPVQALTEVGLFWPQAFGRPAPTAVSASAQAPGKADSQSAHGGRQPGRYY